MANTPAGRRRWAEPFQRIFEVDALRCASCGRDLSVVEDSHRPLCVLHDVSIHKSLAVWSLFYGTIALVTVITLSMAIQLTLVVLRGSEFELK